MSLQVVFLGIIKSFLVQKAGRSPSEDVIKVNSSFHLLWGELELSDASHNILSFIALCNRRTDFYLRESSKFCLLLPFFLFLFPSLPVPCVRPASRCPASCSFWISGRGSDSPCPGVPWHGSHRHLCSCLFGLRTEGKNR